MMLKKLFILAAKNVLNNHRKSRLALLSIASGFLSLNLFQAYIHDTELLFDANYSTRAMLGDILVRKDDRHANMNSQESSAVEDFVKRHHDDIFAAARFLNFTGVINSGEAQTYFVGYGYDTEEGRKIRGDAWAWNVVAGVPLDRANRPGIALGRRLADVLGCREEKPYRVMTKKVGYKAEERPFHCPSPTLQLSLTTAKGQVNALELEPLALIDGSFSDIDQRLVTAPLAVVQNILRTDEISSYSIKFAPGADRTAVQKDFDETVKSKFPTLNFKSWSEYEVGDFYVKSLEFLHIFRNFMTIVIISIASLSVLGTFFRLVYERTREIGTLLSIGFRISQIYILFAFESLILCLFGVTIGAVLSFVIASVLNVFEFPYKLGMLTEPVPFSMSISPHTLWLSAIVVTIVAMTFSMVPVFRALKMKIADALRDI